MPSTRLVPVGGIRHTLAEPGETQVAVRYEVDAASGRVHLTARYAGATDAPTLPAFGLEWTLPKQYENLRFYGLAPEETYHDRLHGGKLGLRPILERARENMHIPIAQIERHRTSFRRALSRDGPDNRTLARPRRPEKGKPPAMIDRKRGIPRCNLAVGRHDIEA